MNKTFLIIIISLLLSPFQTQGSNNLAARLSGKILLQVENNGEAWYVNPDNLQRYYLGKPADAFIIMRELGLGINNKDLRSFNNIAPKKLSGKILINVEDKGKAYYINPIDLRIHYLGKPKDAFLLMRELGLGITNNDLSEIIEFNQNKIFILNKAPFTSQAPFAEWNEQMFQDGCEEASIIMAMAWVNQKEITPQNSKDTIINLSNFQKKLDGNYQDRSAKDTTLLIKKYYNYNNIEYQENTTIKKIINELSNGHIIIAPMNGQALGNKFFNPPGPINHMILITGYDESKNEFITNDPGTKRGESYKYNTNTLFNALRDYPTGYHEPNQEIHKNIIIIKKTPTTSADATP